MLIGRYKHAEGRHELKPKMKEDNVIVESSEVLPNESDELGNIKCLSTESDYKAVMTGYRSNCVCGRPTMQLGLSCGQNCKFDGRKVDETIEGLRTDISKSTERFTRRIGALSVDDTLECMGADIRDFEKRAAADVKNIRDTAEMNRMEIMDRANKDLHNVSLQAYKDEGEVLTKASQDSKGAREKAYTAYQEEVTECLKFGNIQNERAKG